jgi:hypothetical protein
MTLSEYRLKCGGKEEELFFNIFSHFFLNKNNLFNSSAIDFRSLALSNILVLVDSTDMSRATTARRRRTRS